MTSLIAAIFVASLLGSLHCVGMCGAFVALAVGDTRGWRPAAAYHGGRLVSYALLGAAAGAAGQLIDLAGSLAGVRPLAAALAGATMVLFGLVALLRSLGVRIQHLHLPQSWTALVSRFSAAAMNRPPIARASIIGLCTTLLPCGWLYAFAVTAAGTGSPLKGAAAMAVFWLGTLPALIVVGVGVQRLLGPIGRRTPVFASLLLVVVGLYTLAGRISLDPVALSNRAQTGAASSSCCSTTTEHGH